MKPLVSILCITYNQVEFIRRALDGFIMQKTNFDFEVLINDDASTDGTTEIIKEYQEKYPDIIKINIQNENQYSKGNMGLFVEFLFPKITGKYVALCEGDDYWIDENKLQIQVDFLENNPDYSLCFNRSRVIFENNEEKESLYPLRQDGEEFTLERLLKENYIQTNSVMYRKKDYANMRTDVMPQDWYMHLYHAQSGRIGFIDKVMSVYRRHEGGIWWESRGRMDGIYLKHHNRLLNLYVELLEMFGGNNDYEAIINNHLRHLINAMLDIDRENPSSLIVDTARDFPSIIYNFLDNQKKYIDELQLENIRLSKLNSKLAGVREELSHVTEELNSIKKSKWYKLNPMRVLRNLND